MEDRKLIEAVLAGDREAFSPLMDRYYSMVYRMCLNMTGNVPDAEELAHDSFVEAYLKLGQLREPDRFGGWIKTLTLNLCRMWYRRNQQRTVELVEDQVPAVEDEAEDPLIYARMSYGLSTLSAPHRLVLVLHYYEGLSYDEVATFLEVPKGTVMSRLHRARQALKEVMEQMNEQEEIPAVPDDRFKEVVQAEIAVLLKMFPDEPNVPERLTVVLKKSAERLASLVADADEPEMLRSLAILLPHLGVEAVDTVLDCCFSMEQPKSVKAAELLRSYAARCRTMDQRDGMQDMALREAYLILDRLIAHPASDDAKAELLLDMMESAEENCPALLFTNALLCYQKSAFPLLMERFMSESSARVLHALVRTGALFAEGSLEMLKSGDAEKQAAGLVACEAIARSLRPSWRNESNIDQFMNDVRISEKWPPLRVEDVGQDLLDVITCEVASIVKGSLSELRSHAVRVLGHLRAGDRASLIRESLETGDTATRLAAIFALSEIGDSESADAFINIARNGDWQEKAAAAAAIGRLQIGSAEHVLVELTKDDQDNVREAAVGALGEMGTVSSQVVLQELMKGSDKRLQKAAAKAMFGGVPQRKPVLSDVQRRLAEKRRKVTPVAVISPDATMRFGLTEMRSYDEQDLTERIAKVCSDYCATRRYMVELGLMTRSNGVYDFTESGKSAWRVEQFICERYLARCN